MVLTPQHHKAIILLSEGLNNKEVAEQLKLAPETISRYKANFNFKAELNRLLNTNLEAQQEKLRSLTSVALETIESVLVDNEAPHKDKITAAFKVLELTGLKQSSIGSSNPATLQKQFEDDKLLDSYGF